MNEWVLICACRVGEMGTDSLDSLVERILCP